MNITDILHRFSHLPAVAIAAEVNDALRQHQAVVVTAPPGAGKSTLLPITILQSLQQAEKVLMLEPRRLAARQIAERMADMMGEKTGQTVGYRVRFESRTSARTRIEVLTEGILTRMLVDDATLDGVEVVVFDEFHERSLNSDLALALVREAQQVLRPDLKIVIMSATIDAASVCEALQAPLVECQGRMFPVELSYTDADFPLSDCASAVVSAVRSMHETHEGDILAFLPGQGEIMRCCDLLADTLAPTRVLPLYGQLPPGQQRAAIVPSCPGERKVVLATPIAETSLTIEGVRMVVDSGLCRSQVYDARTGLSHLETVRISRDMAMQRMGRAGRVSEGHCLRLWSRAADLRMEAQRKPEIAEADLASVRLSVAAFGERDMMSLPWLTLPPRPAVKGAEALLRTLGAIETDGRITDLGRRMASLPCHPRIARMMLGAGTPALQALACDIAALLEEKDPMAEGESVDLSLRVSRLRQLHGQAQARRWMRVLQTAREYRRMLRVEECHADVAPEDVGLLVALAYPERVAQASDAIGTYRLAGGGSVRLEQSDWLTSHPWLAVASMNAAAGQTGRVFLAAPVDTAGLASALGREVDRLSWDNKQGCITSRREVRVGQLVLSSRPLTEVSQEQLVEVVCEAAERYGQGMFSWDESVSRLQQRVAQVAIWHPELSIPDLSTEALLRTARQWLPFCLTPNGRVLTSAADLRRLDLASILWNTIPYDLQQTIDRLAPTHIEVPTGSRVRVDYRPGAAAPVLSVRLQECFGMQQTPTVDDGRIPVLMELLSPGYKPVQLTQDLPHFWQTTYFDVRKELRRRYPKHSWPENPLEAEAVRGVKRPHHPH